MYWIFLYRFFKNMSPNFPKIATHNTILSTFSNAEKKQLPFYMVTADPFWALLKWEHLSKDDSFMGALQWVVDFNELAIHQNKSASGMWNHVHYGFERPEKSLNLHSADISLIALMLSLEDTIKAQHWVTSRLWFITWSDLSNIQELFETVSQSKPRAYHSTMIQMLHWFYKVRYQYYEFDVRSAREEEFRDFEMIGWSIEGIRERVKHCHNGKLHLSIERGLDMVFDFRNATTELVIHHQHWQKHEMFDVIKKNNPFKNQERANILFPLGTAGWTLPLINLTRITFENWNWKEKEKTVFQFIKSPELQSWVVRKAQKILENPLHNR